MSTKQVRGWLPDFLFRNGRFEKGVAMFADETGRIVRFSQDPEDLQLAQRLPRKAILPGLVNAHSHSFQRAIRARTEHRTGAGSDSFWTWREAMYHAATRLSPEDIYDVARMAFLEMLASGITTVGEFHYPHRAADGTPYENPNLLGEQVVRAAQETGLRIALLRTAYARAGFRKAANPGQARFITPDSDDFIADTDSLRAWMATNFAADAAWVGVAPHSVRALPLPYMIDVVRYAQANNLPVHMHVAEQPAEVEACEAEHGLRPILLLARHDVLHSRFTGVHAIHVTDAEIECFHRAQATVCACPTTERNLGDGIVPADRWAAARVGICYGSDSNIQVNLLEDARELEYHLRLEQLRRAVLDPCSGQDGSGHDSSGQAALPAYLFANATVVGAASLGAPGGTLEEGRTADFFTIDLNDLSVAGADPASLLAHVVFSAERTAIRDVVIGGRTVIEDGRHALSEAITRRFAAVQEKLWGSNA